MTLSPLAKKVSHALVVGAAGGLSYLVGALGAGHFPGFKVLLAGFACVAVARIAGYVLAGIPSA